MPALSAVALFAALGIPHEIRPGMPADEARRIAAAAPPDIPGGSGPNTILLGSGDYSRVVLTTCGGVVIQVDAVTGESLADFSSQVDLLRLQHGPPKLEVLKPDDFPSGGVDARWETADASYYMAVGDRPPRVSYSAAVLSPPPGCAFD